jgi:putative hydrolase of the HAD superfamily
LGNDMRNDIVPAARTGFQTVLFAGDARSLRLRSESPECKALRPNAIVTHLAQLCGLMGLTER